MRQTRTKRLLAFFLSAIMLIGTAVPSFAADSTTTDDSANQLVTVSDSLSFITYEEYLTKYPDVEESRATQSFTIKASEYDEEETTSEVEVKELQGEECLDTSSEGSVTWKFNVPESGFYTLTVRYCPTSELSSAIERILYINGKVPFKETRLIEISKTWEYEYAGDPDGERDGLFEKDASGNELRPDCDVSYAWAEYTVKDSNGYYTTPFEYYLEEGENTITLQAVRDTAAFESFTFAPYEPLKSYEEVSAEYAANGYTEATDVETIHLNAESPDAVSDYTIYPITDYSSAITEPQSTNLTVLNTIGKDKWTNTGSWIRYTFTVEKSGLYVIAPRYKQSIQEGLFVSRELRIDGEVPFEEASSIRFSYSKDWQVAPLSDDDGNPFEFYLEAGEHTIELEVCLGDMAKILQQASNIMDSINDDYLEITKLTGQDADENRDYGFARVMPETVADLSVQSTNLKAIIRMLSATSGINSSSTGTLNTMVELLRKMGADESKIAANLDELQEQISSLGEWISDMSSQPLEMDYILIQPASAEYPKANSGFFKAVGFELGKFFASFVSDYDSIASDDATGYDGELLVWTTSGRDQALIINNLIKDGFTKENNVEVTLKLTASNSLLVSILAGIAPDVSIDAASPLDLAVRGALVSLNDFDTYDEVMSRFSESAVVALQLYGDTYAVPTVLKFSMMFYRTDILADLGLEVPETWDDLMSMVPVLQFNNMNIGIGADFSTLVFQGGGSWWDDEGMITGLDSTASLDALTTLCNFFTQYSLPITFSAVNRMKTGEMPIVIQDYSLYNTLIVSAPEISGLWSIAQVPGTKRTDENGDEYVDRTVGTTASGIIMPTSARDQELAWKFMDWFSDKDYQVDYSNEMVALLGPSAKQQVANIEAFEELPWTSDEKAALSASIENSKGIEIYPGDYIVMRYLNFMFNRAYTDLEDPATMMQDYAVIINKELTRKREEFGYMVEADWLAVKEYTGLDTYSEWRAYAEENGIDDYEDWMKDIGISSDNYETWEKQVDKGETTLDYKTWISENK